MGVNILFERDSRVVITIELEMGVTGAGILGVVVGKLHHWQWPCLVVLLLIDECSEVCFHSAVLSLDLAVCLRVEGS